MSTTARPSAARRRVTSSNRSASASVSTAVGSSRRSTSGSASRPEQFEPLAFTDRHRRHSGGRVDVEAESLGERSEVDRRPGCDVRRARWARNSRRLSTATIVGTRAKCCCTKVTPTASLGDAGANRSAAHLPVNCRSRPPRMRISVVLPAPFSPRIASTSPARMSRSTSRSACTSPKRRETPTTWGPAEPASTPIPG